MYSFTGVYKMKRNPLRSLLPLTLVACFLLSACHEPVSTETDNSQTDTSSETETEKKGLDLGMPERDFNGETFSISTYCEADFRGLYAEGYTGEILNDTIYENIELLTDEYNFKYFLRNDFARVPASPVDKYYGEVNGQKDMIRQCITSGDDLYDWVNCNDQYSAPLVLEGCFYNLYEIPNLNFENPWWPSQTIEEMTVYNKMYTTYSYITYLGISQAEVFIFNKDLHTIYNLDNPYDLVREGKWTLDTMISQTVDVYNDVNADGTKDEEDVYGFVTQPNQMGIVIACEIPILSRTEDGGRELTVMSDRTVTLLDKLYSWYYESEGIYLVDMPYDMFKMEKGIYSWGRIWFATDYYRDAEFDFGILPQPKFDENQEGYHVFSASHLFSMPISCLNIDMAGFLFEACSAYGYHRLLPAYTEVVLEGKIADSPDDVEMLQLISKNLNVPFSHCYDFSDKDGFVGFGNMLTFKTKFTVKNGNKNLASVYKSSQKYANRYLNELLDAFRDTEE